MEGSGRLLRHFKMPDWRAKKLDKNQDRQYSAEDYEASDEQSESQPESYHGCDDRTLSTNRLKKVSKNLELKDLELENPFSEPSPPSPATEETREDLLAGLKVEENETGARDDRAIETDTMEKDLENMLLMEEKKEKKSGGEKKSEGEKKGWGKRKSWDKKSWRKKRSGDEKKGEDKKSGDETLPLSSENLSLPEKKKKSGGETAARDDSAIEMEKMQKNMENLLLVKERKSWRRKSSWRKTKRGREKQKIEGIVWPNSPGSPGAKRLPILLRGESEPGRKKNEEEGPSG